LRLGYCQTLIASEGDSEREDISCEDRSIAQGGQLLPARRSGFDLDRNAVQRYVFRAAHLFDDATIDDGFLRIDQIDHLASSIDRFCVVLMGLRPIRIKGLVGYGNITISKIARQLLEEETLLRYTQHLRLEFPAPDNDTGAKSIERCLAATIAVAKIDCYLFVG
jgi:hypothetical protein